MTMVLQNAQSIAAISPTTGLPTGNGAVLPGYTDARTEVRPLTTSFMNLINVMHDRSAFSGSGQVGGRVRAGLGFALLSASSFGLSGPLARGLMDAGWSSAAAVAARVLLAAAVLAPIAAVALRGRWSLLRRTAPLITAYGLVAVAGCQLAFFNAVAHMEVGVALLIGSRPVNNPAASGPRPHSAPQSNCSVVPSGWIRRRIAPQEKR